MYTVEEKRDMYDVYIRNNRNSVSASENYRMLYPERLQPDRTIFARISKNLALCGSFRRPRGPYRMGLNANEVNVLAQLVIDPENSSRRIAEECGIHDSSVRKIIKKHKYHDYKFKPVQNLHPGDAERRLHFCNWFREKLQQDPQFPRKVLWTDESLFTNSGMFNRKNLHHYATENPHLVRETRHQIRYSLNVWAGILDNVILGPFFINNRLDGATYLNFLQTDLENMLDELPLVIMIRNFEWFHQDGAAPHNSRIVKKIYLDVCFPNSWMGTYGPIQWPPRSPCLSPLDYFLWGAVKNRVYSIPTRNLEHLRQKIENAFHSISDRSIQKAVDEMDMRTDFCFRNNGEHFEQFLK